jgi:hypothetical protein
MLWMDGFIVDFFPRWQLLDFFALPFTKYSEQFYYIQYLQTTYEYVLDYDGVYFIRPE